MTLSNHQNPISLSLSSTEMGLVLPWAAPSLSEQESLRESRGIRATFSMAFDSPTYPFFLALKKDVPAKFPILIIALPFGVDLAFGADFAVDLFTLGLISFNTLLCFDVDFLDFAGAFFGAVLPFASGFAFSGSFSDGTLPLLLADMIPLGAILCLDIVCFTFTGDIFRSVFACGADLDFFDGTLPLP